MSLKSNCHRWNAVHPGRTGADRVQSELESCCAGLRRCHRQITRSDLAPTPTTTTPLKLPATNRTNASRVRPTFTNDDLIVARQFMVHVWLLADVSFANALTFKSVGCCETSAVGSFDGWVAASDVDNLHESPLRYDAAEICATRVCVNSNKLYRQ